MLQITAANRQPSRSATIPCRAPSAPPTMCQPTPTLHPDQMPPTPPPDTLCTYLQHVEPLSLVTALLCTPAQFRTIARQCVLTVLARLSFLVPTDTRPSNFNYAKGTTYNHHRPPSPHPHISLPSSLCHLRLPPPTLPLVATRPPQPNPNKWQ